MNDNAIDSHRSHDPAGGIRAIELIILGTCVFVVVGGSTAVGVLIWPHLNPSSWTAGGWAAVGAWFAGVITAASIWFAVRTARESQTAAMRLLTMQLSEEGRREQLRTVGQVYSGLRDKAEAIETFYERWHSYSAATKAYDRLESAGQPTEDLFATRDVLTSVRKDFLDARTQSQELAASLKDIFLEAMWTVSEPTVRAELDELHKACRQLSQFIEIAYMNFPFITLAISKSTGEPLTLVAIRGAINKHSHELVVSAQGHLGNSVVNILEGT